MAYTPINWQTGDTITAEKMNKMDNGWGVTTESTTLFEGSVTTTAGGDFAQGSLQYSGIINQDTVTVTFNGTDYVCNRIDAFGQYFYGGFSEQGPDFSDYPFALASSPEGVNGIYTQTAGTYTLKIEALLETVETTNSFQNAVKSCIDISGIKILECVENVTTLSEAQGMIDNGGIVYFTAAEDSYAGASKHLFFINATGTICTIFPASTKIAAKFSRESALFFVNYI